MTLYKIVITQHDYEEKKDTDWLQLHDKEEFDTKRDPQYGYVSTMKMKEIETKIYEQTSNKEIALKRIIDAFNYDEKDEATPLPLMDLKIGK